MEEKDKNSRPQKIGIKTVAAAVVHLSLHKRITNKKKLKHGIGQHYYYRYPLFKIK